MTPLVERIAISSPTLRDGIYVFPQEWDVPAVIGTNDVGWKFVDLRHLDAPPQYRHGALLADGRVVLPALLWFKNENRARKAIGEFQRPMAAEHYRETFLVEVALLRSIYERDTVAARLVDELADVVKATIEDRIGAACVL